MYLKIPWCLQFGNSDERQAAGEKRESRHPCQERGVSGRDACAA